MDGRVLDNCNKLRRKALMKWPCCCCLIAQQTVSVQLTRCVGIWIASIEFYCKRGRD